MTRPEAVGAVLARELDAVRRRMAELGSRRIELPDGSLLGVEDVHGDGGRASTSSTRGKMPTRCPYGLYAFDDTHLTVP